MNENENVTQGTKVKKEKTLQFRFFWLTVLVCICSLAVQVAVSLVGSNVISFVVAFQAAASGMADYTSIEQMCLEAVMANMGVLVFAAHVALILVFSLWYRLGVRKQRVVAPLKEVITPKNMRITALLALGLCFLTNFGMEALLPVIPESIVDSYMTMMENAGVGEDVFTIIATVCLAPIGEELIFRGVTLHFAEKFTANMKNRAAAFWIANALQALWFGVFHGNLIQGSYAFLLGMGLGYLAKRYKSVIPAMIAHCIINASSSFLWGFVYYAMPQSTPAFGVGALVCLVIVAIAFKLGGNPLKEQEA